jgi:zinc transport system ATP-binding protein
VTASSQPVLTCERLVLGYGAPILPPIDLTIRGGELWAIMGLNGAGKSTWMRTVLDLQPAFSGKVTRAPGLRVAYVPQQAALDPIYPVKAHDMVEMGLLGPSRVLGFPSSDERRRCREALEQVGIPDLAGKPLRDLSGGQRQRVLIARAIASGAQLFFFDEPTSALDYQAEMAVFELIDDLRHRPGAAVAIITHEMHVLRTRGDRALLLDREHQIVVSGKAADVAASEAYTHLFGPASPAAAHASEGHG